MHISVISIFLTYLNAICLCVFSICVLILQADIESRLQRCMTIVACFSVQCLECYKYAYARELA